MPSPTPNGPTLNDLEYGGYNQAGYLNVTTLIPFDVIPVSDATITSENVVLNLPGISYSVDTSDFISASESKLVGIDVLAGNQFSITVSDTSITSENVDPLKAGARFVNVSDSTATSENVVAVKA